MTTGLIGAGLIGIIISAFSITLTSFQQSSRALAQKMEISQLQSNIKGRLADGALCECNVAYRESPATGSGGGRRREADGGADQQRLSIPLSQLSGFSVELGALYGRCAAGSRSNPIIQAGEPVADSLTTLGVQEIAVMGFRQINATTLTADLQVRFNPEGLVVGRKPLSIPLTIQVNLNGGQARVMSCTTEDPPDPSHGIPGSLAGDPGTQCSFARMSNGPTGITLYRTQPAPAPPDRMCCVTTMGSGGEFFKCL